MKISQKELDPKTRQQVFEAIWNRINVTHFDTAFGGVSWAAMKTKYAPLVAKVKNNAEFYTLLTRLIGELKQSHFAILPPEAYSVSEAVGKAAKGEGASGLTVGLIDSQPMVIAVAPSSAGQAAGILPGAILEAVDGKPLLQVLARLTPDQKKTGYLSRVLLTRALGGDEGQKRALRLREPDGSVHEIELTLGVGPKKRDDVLPGFPPFPAELETRRLENNIGYVRFSLFTALLMDDLRKAFKEVADAPGMIIDLRGNPGGLGPVTYAIAGMLSQKPGTLGTMTMRRATVQFPILPQAPRYAGPVVVLTDELSASCSEILAGGLQELKRAVVIGRKTAGMVLPSAVDKLPGGVRLQYAFADFKTPRGVLLEGKGVIPDIAVPLTQSSLRQLGDPDIAAALAYFRTQTEKK
ncbi:S41 family peptidase [Armatimonas sp.]|uniref:S41 family peptidase n=1 Tax=Armatimonas sp. TaxID=1872638 RepID=UPI003750FD54